MKKVLLTALYFGLCLSDFSGAQSFPLIAITSVQEASSTLLNECVRGFEDARSRPQWCSDRDRSHSSMDNPRKPKAARNFPY